MSSIRSMAGRVAGIASLMVAAASAASAESFEVDVFFPRNETYINPGILPIAVAVQNFTTLAGAPNITFSWDIMPYAHGVTPSGVTYDSGTFDFPENMTNPLTLVSYTNVTSWLARKTSTSDRLRLHVWADFGSASGYCGASATDLGNMQFNIETAAEAAADTSGNVKNATLTETSDCPAFGAIVELAAAASSGSDSDSCSYSIAYNTASASGAPCSANLAVEAKTSISSAAHSQATAAAASKATATGKATKTTKGTTTITGTATATATGTDSGSSGTETSKNAGALNTGAALPPALAAIAAVYMVYY